VLTAVTSVSEVIVIFFS